MRLDPGYLSSIAQSKQYTGITGRTITAVAVDAPPKRSCIAAENSHACAQHIAVKFLPHHAKSNPWFAMADVIDEKTRWAIVVDHQDINISVIVDVTEGCATAHFQQRKRSSRTAADIFKAPLSVVVQ